MAAWTRTAAVEEPHDGTVGHLGSQFLKPSNAFEELEAGVMWRNHVLRVA